MSSLSGVQNGNDPITQSFGQLPANGHRLIDPKNEYEAPNKYPDCAICDQIWWLLTTKRGENRRWIDLGTRAEALTTKCARHKRLVEDNYPQTFNDWLSDPAYHFLIISETVGTLSTSYSENLRFFKSPHQYWMVKKPEVRHHPGIARNLDPSWINLDHAKEWLSRCKSEHTQCAKPFANWQAPIRPCWLVDVQDRCLVPGSNVADYIALSYSWGDNKGLVYEKETLAQLKRHKGLDEPGIVAQLSTIVRHTIELTRALGQQYLWVDNLCIPQSADSAEELQNMGAIYANAALTIVAFDNNGPNGLVGLKGISSPRSASQWIDEHIDFGDEVFNRGRDTVIYLTSDMRPSGGYHSRAWTFQEFELSRRRLIMEGGSLYWMCQERSWQEHCHDDVVMQDGLQRHASGILRGFPSTASLGRIIRSYARRDLSYQEDALPGVSGILTTLSRAFEGGFLCGIPVEVFEAGLCWRAESRDRWGALHRRSPSNRPFASRLHPSHLPSWSWIGCRGDIDAASSEACVIRSDHSYVYETFSTAPWYSMDATKPGEARRIESKRLSNRTSYKNPNFPLPPGWTRHTYDNEEASRLYPSGCGTYFYRHVNMSADDSPWYWPFPVQDRVEGALLPIMLDQLPNISCTTTRAFLSGFQTADKNWGIDWPIFSLSSVHLYDHSSRPIGILVPDTEAGWLAFPLFEPGDIEAKKIELVVICGRTHYTRLGRKWETLDHIQRTELYAVLWIEWREGIAHRLGYGEVDKDAWDALPLENIDLILG